MARPHRVVLVEVTCPDGASAPWGNLQPCVKVGEGKVRVGRVVDVEDLKWLGFQVERYGGDEGRRNWDLLNGSGVDSCVH